MKDELVFKLSLPSKNYYVLFHIVGHFRMVSILLMSISVFILLLLIIIAFEDVSSCQCVTKKKSVCHVVRIL